MKEEKGATWKETSVLMTSPGLEAGGASKRPDMADGGGGWAGDGGQGGRVERDGRRNWRRPGVMAKVRSKVGWGHRSKVTGQTGGGAS